MSLEELQNKYIEMFGKLPINKKNDADRLLKKIQGGVQEDETTEEKVEESVEIVESIKETVEIPVLFVPKNEIETLQQKLVPLQAKYRELMNLVRKHPNLNGEMNSLEKEIQAIIAKQRYIGTL